MNFTVRSLQAGSIAELQAAVYLGPGAILIDEYDNQIMDDVRRVSIAWNRIDKRLAPGEQDRWIRPDCSRSRSRGSPA